MTLPNTSGKMIFITMTAMDLVFVMGLSVALFRLSGWLTPFCGWCALVVVLDLLLAVWWGQTGSVSALVASGRLTQSVSWPPIFLGYIILQTAIAAGLFVDAAALSAGDGDNWRLLGFALVVATPLVPVWGSFLGFAIWPCVGGRNDSALWPLAFAVSRFVLWYGPPLGAVLLVRHG